MMVTSYPSKAVYTTSVIVSTSPHPNTSPKSAHTATRPNSSSVVSFFKRASTSGQDWSPNSTLHSKPCMVSGCWNPMCSSQRVIVTDRQLVHPRFTRVANQIFRFRALNRWKYRSCLHLPDGGMRTEHWHEYQFSDMPIDANNLLRCNGWIKYWTYSSTFFFMYTTSILE